MVYFSLEIGFFLRPKCLDMVLADIFFKAVYDFLGRLMGSLNYLLRHY